METTNKQLNFIRIREKHYNTRLFLLISDVESMRKFFNDKYKYTYDKNPITHSSDGALFTFDNNKTGIPHHVIWLEDYNNSPKWIGILAHELLHLTFRVLGDRGFRHVEESEEAYTYFHGDVFEACMKKLQPQKSE